MNYFFSDNATPWLDLGGGVSRKIIAYTPELMGVVVRFQKGSIGTPHSHEIHNQISYVAAGSFEATIDGQKKTLRVGDAYIAPKQIVHGVVALEDGSILVDMFSPRRDDFLGK
ncbi:MAG TPA: cupin domain-containing protein [Opitutaceae bacterium]|nr:cupin domain-containing protein [Opitutaceae bacterium]